MKSVNWRYKAAVEGEKLSNWFSLPHIDDEFFIAGQQYLAWRPGWIKNQNGKNYMIPDPCGGKRLWFGVGSENDKMAEGKKYICSPDSPIYAKVDEIPEECKSLGISPNVASHFFNNPWNFYVIEYLEILDENGIVLNKRGNPQRNKFTRLMSPKEISSYCRDWISVLNDFPEDGLSRFDRVNGSAKDIRDYFAAIRSVADFASQMYSMTEFVLPRSNPAYLPVIK